MKFAIFVSQAEIRTTFQLKVVQIPARNTKVYKNGKFHKAIFAKLCSFTKFKMLFPAVVLEFVFHV